MTAVEFLEKAFLDPSKNRPFIQTDEWEQAKQMERRQTIDFATNFAKDYIGFDSVSSDPNAASPAQHYYNQTKK